MRLGNEVLHVGLVGGGADKSKGETAFIALRHSDAVHLGGSRQITDGALHYNPKVALACARGWKYPIRGHASVDAMIDYQLSLPRNKRIHFVIIATPNREHYKQARAFVDAGISVVCEKPITLTVEEAAELAAAVAAKNLPFMVFHTYWGHVMTQLARFIVRSGLLGRIIGGKAEYDQDWLRRKLESMGVTQAWRAKKAVCGMSCAGGDIGIHAEKHWDFVTGDPVIRIADASLRTIVPGRELDDVFFTRCETGGGAEVVIRAAQVYAGCRNRLRLEVNGTDATLIQDLEHPEELTILRPGKAELVYHRGQVPKRDEFLRKPVPNWLLNLSYWPAGHPEGLTDAVGHLYDAFELDVRRHYRGQKQIYAGERYAGVEDGLSHMCYLKAAVEAANSGLQVVI
jgi:predicted dehydrogenase